MRFLLTLITGLALLILEAAWVGVFDVDTFLPHVAPALILYLALQKDVFEGGVEAALIAWAADLLGAAPPGMNALALTLLFFALRAAGARLAYRSLLVRAGLAVAAAAFTQAVVLLALLVTLGELRLLASFGVAALPSCLAAPLGLLLTWPLLARIDAFFQPKTRNLLSE